MNKQDIEKWALSVINRVENGQPLEDSRVECKSIWLDAQKAARQIAAIANAAYGDNVLWIIGVDQKAKIVCGATDNELANWYPQVKKHFDNGVAPSLITDLNITYNNKTIIALLFDTKDAPYVVKVPDTDRLEVAWREGTRTRSATRAEILKIFLSLQSKGIVSPLTDFDNESPRARMLAIEKPPYWEYLLTLELLNPKLREVRRSFNEVEKGLIYKKSQHLSSVDIPRFIQAKLHDLQLLLPLLQVVIQEEIPASWGKLGEAGNERDIKRAIDKLIAVCKDLVDWESDLVTTSFPEDFESLIFHLKGFTSATLSEVENFAEQITEIFSQPDTGETYNVNLTFNLPVERIEKMSDEIHRLAQEGVFD